MRRRRGQSLVETALILTAFMMLLLAMVWIGQTIFARQTLAERAHDAARWGAMNQYDPSAIRNLVLYGTSVPAGHARPILGLSSDEVEIANPGCPGPQCMVSVAIPGQGIRSVEPAE